MPNYKLEIQYSGKNYSGWQIQENAPTIQSEIKKNIEKILSTSINLIGSGRTDAGVHALGQVANFHALINDEVKFLYSLNSLLPNDISVNYIEKVSDDFNSRFDAKSRSYIYLFNEIKSPFYFDFSYRLSGLNYEQIEKLKELSKNFLGTHDFSSFTKHQEEVENKICEVKNIGWRKNKNLSIFYIEGNRFLHGMVRAIIGSLLLSVKENLNDEYFYDLFNAKDRTKAGMSVPAKGLFLYKVKY